jgi:four helix bundle protein
MHVRNYRDLHVWNAAVDLARNIYVLTERFPPSERLGLSQQLRRAAVSVPFNIAEGHARGTTNEFVRFIRIARGSLAEITTQILLAQALRFLRSEDVERVMPAIDGIGRMLRRLEQSLRRRAAD